MNHRGTEHTEVAQRRAYMPTLRAKPHNVIEGTSARPTRYRGVVLTPSRSDFSCAFARVFAALHEKKCFAQVYLAMLSRWYAISPALIAMGKKFCLGGRGQVA